MDKKDRINIRVATAADSNIIADFQQKMALETENLRLDGGTLEKGVAAVFDNPGLGRYFVAEHQGTVIASMMTTYEWSDWRNAMVWWLQSVYVLPAYRKQGIFKKMYDHVKALLCETPGVAGIRLYVDRSNTPAQSVYRAVGMDGEHYQLFEWMK